VTLGRVSFAAILAALTLTSAACGSDDSRDESDLLPAALADDLARQSDNVQNTLKHGDGCTAEAQARALRGDIQRAIAGGVVPDQLSSELSARAQRLVDSIECNPLPPPPPPAQEPQEPEESDDDEDARGKQKGHDKKGHEKEDD
jgi:hypothetical protein